MKNNRVLIVAGLAKLLLHLALVGRYGIHRDEYYFLECGEHFAWGYVDHPPLVPWIVRLSTELLGTNVVAIRIMPILAGMLAIALAILVVRELRGGPLAEAVAAAAMLSAPAMLRMSATLTIPAFELVFWTGATLLSLRILRGASPRLWLAVGAVAGVGLLNKHTMLLWGLGLGVGLLLTEHRRHLGARWIWLGAGVAAAVFAPNLWWQATHDWPTVAFVHAMRESTLASVGRELFVLGQVLYQNPLTLPIWIAGLVELWRSPRGRPAAIAFATVLATLLITRAKPYYLTPAYPVLFAAGGVSVERWLRRRAPLVRRAIPALWCAAVLPMMVLSLPVLALETTDRALGAAFGDVVPPIALTHDMHDEYGWREQALTVAAIASEHPNETLRVVVGNYGQASALRYHRRELALPPAVSGHMSHYLWGPGDDAVDRLIVYGLPASTVQRLCLDAVQVAVIDHPLANLPERNLAVTSCRPRAPLAAVWPSLRRYGHGRSPELDERTAHRPSRSDP